MLLALGAALSLAGCGQKGSLYLPDDEQKKKKQQTSRARERVVT